jgi:hypothetical protein
MWCEGTSRLGPFPLVDRDGSLQASGCSPLSLLTFFAAAKKVSAAPHRGEANRPIRKQGKANAVGKQPKTNPTRPTRMQGKPNTVGKPPTAAGKKTYPHLKDFSHTPHDFAVVISAHFNPSPWNGNHLLRTPPNPIWTQKKQQSRG